MGYLFDLEGNPFLNQYEPFLYSPSESLTAYVYANQFMEGTITFNNQSSKEAQLKFINGKVFTTGINGGRELKVKTSSFVSARIGPDSLFTISQYKTLSYIRQTAQTMIKNGTHICLYEGEAYNLEFASVPKSNKSNSPSVFLMRPKNTTDWFELDISVKKKYLNFLKTYFEESQDLEQQLQFQTYTNGKINELIKRLQFLESFKNKTPLYFNSFYISQNTPTKNTLKAYCVEYGKEIFVLEFYKDSKKVLSLSYSDLVNMTKEGLLRSYYPNGQVNQEKVIEGNSTKRITYNNSEGKVTHEIKKVVNDPYSPLIIYANKYATIYDNDAPIDSINFVDSLNSRTIYQAFKEGKITYSYFEDEGKEIYQITQPGLDLNLSELQNLFILDTKTRKYSTTLKNQEFGYALILVRVNTKGKITQLKSIHTLSSEHKTTINEVLKSSSINGLKIGKYKIDSKPVTYEVVIPLLFKKVNKLPNPRSSYNYMHDQQFHHTPSYSPF